MADFTPEIMRATDRGDMPRSTSRVTNWATWSMVSSGKSRPRAAIKSWKASRSRRYASRVLGERPRSSSR